MPTTPVVLSGPVHRRTVIRTGVLFVVAGGLLSVGFVVEGRAFSGPGTLDFALSLSLLAFGAVSLVGGLVMRRETLGNLPELDDP